MKRAFVMAKAAGLLTAGLIAGCGGDGLGRAIVGEGKLGGTLRPLCGSQTPLCDRPVVGGPALVARQLPLSGGRSCAPTTDQPCLPDAMGLVSLAGCYFQAAEVEGSFDGLGSATCSRVELTASAAASYVRLGDAQLDTAQLTLRSDHAVTFELDHARLAGVRIELDGPVTLRIMGESSLSEVSIAQPAQGSLPGAASLQLVESQVFDLVASNLSGSIEVARSSLTDSQLLAPEVRLETLTVTRVDVATHELTAVAVEGSALTLQFSRAITSNLTLNRLEVQRCDSLLLVSAQLVNALLAPCSGRVRIDQSQIEESFLAGPIETYQTNLLSNAIGGGGSAASVELWDGSLLYNRLCSGLSRLTVGAGTKTLCNFCDELPAPEARLCLAELELGEAGEAQADNPFCSALDEVVERPVCAPPASNEVPTRPR